MYQRDVEKNAIDVNNAKETMKLMLRLVKDFAVEVHIPAPVVFELEGRSSKMLKMSINTNQEYGPFYHWIQVNNGQVHKFEFKENDDFPKKHKAIADRMSKNNKRTKENRQPMNADDVKMLKEEVTNFLQAFTKDESLNKLRNRLNQLKESKNSLKFGDSNALPHLHLTNEYDDAIKGVRKRAEDLNFLSKSLKFKMKWDDEMKANNKLAEKFTPPRKTKAFKYEALQSKFEEIYVNANDEEKFDTLSADELIAQKLVRHQEEFDFFDLQIYLYAKEKNAFVFTRNTQAFQEVEDPMFFNYFKNVKILHPLINPDEYAHVDGKFDIAYWIESAMKNDFNEVSKYFSEFKQSPKDSVEINARLKLTGEKLCNTFEQVLDVMQEHPTTGKSGMYDLEKLSTSFEILKILRLDGDRLKINSDQIFSSADRSDIEKQLNVLEFVKEHIIQNPHDFELNDFTLANRGKGGELHIKDIISGIDTTEHPFINNPKTALEKFVGALNEKDVTLRDTLIKFALNLHVLTSTSGNNVKKFLSELKDQSVIKDPTKCGASLALCAVAVKSGRRKREALDCSPVEKFITREGHVDNEKLLASIKENPDLDTKVLIEFGDHVRGKWLSPSSEFSSLIKRHNFIQHLGKVETVSNCLGMGLLTRDLMVDLIEDNYTAFAMNIGSVAGLQIASVLGEVAKIGGAVLARAGKMIAASLLKIVGPFAQRLGTAFVVYDLVQQIQAFQTGNNDAVADILGDSIMIGAELSVLGASIFEGFGVIAGVSAILGPISAAIGVVILISVETFHAVGHVEQLDSVLHLSTGQRWAAGFESFFHIPNTYEKAAQYKKPNNDIARKALDFMDKTVGVTGMVVPSAIYDPDDNQKSYIDVEVVKNSDINWSLGGPDDLQPDGRIFCSPYNIHKPSGFMVDMEMWKFGPYDEETAPPAALTHSCYNAIGVGVLDWDKKTNGTILFNLGPSTGTIQGFDQFSHHFYIDNNHGEQSVQGADKNDVFAISGTGKSLQIDGLGGDNTIDISRAPKNFTAFINFHSGRLTSNPDSFYTSFKNINMFKGRENGKEEVIIGCGTKYVNGQGSLQSNGIEYRGHDQIIIQAAKNCYYNLTIQLNAYTNISNQAHQGEFRYIIGKSQKHANVHTFNDSEANITTRHTFFIAYTLVDLLSITPDYSKDDRYKFKWNITFGDENSAVAHILQLNTNNFSIHLNDSTEITMRVDGILVRHKSHADLDYLKRVYQDKADQLNATLFLRIDSLNASVIIEGNENHNMFQSEASRNTIFFLNKGHISNVISIHPNTSDISIGRYPTVDIHIKNPQNTLNTIDLRQLVKKLKNDGKELLLKHTIYKDQFVQIRFILKGTATTFLMISVSNTNCAFLSNLHIILDNVPLMLKCNHHLFKPESSEVQYQKNVLEYRQRDYCTPVPLELKDTEIIILTHKDLDYSMDVIIRHELGRFKWITLDKSLAVIRMNSAVSYPNNPFAVVFQDFFAKSDLFYTIRIIFDDIKILLNDHRDHITTAPSITHFRSLFSAQPNPQTNGINENRPKIPENRPKIPKSRPKKTENRAKKLETRPKNRLKIPENRPKKSKNRPKQSKNRSKTRNF